MRNYQQLFLTIDLIVWSVAALAVDPVAVRHGSIPGDAQIITNTAALYADATNQAASTIAQVHTNSDKIASVSSGLNATSTLLQQTVANLNICNAALNTHVANKSNPHAVTAAQVGAATTAALADEVTRATAAESANATAAANAQTSADTANATFANYLPLSGGALNGNLFVNGTLYLSTGGYISSMNISDGSHVSLNFGARELYGADGLSKLDWTSSALYGTWTMDGSPIATLSDLGACALASSNYTALATSGIAGQTWARPGDWKITYHVLDDSTATGGVVSVATNADGRVIASHESWKALRTSARLYTTSLDELAASEPPPVVFKVVSGIATITGNVVVLSTAGGVVQVSAKAENATRYASIPLYSRSTLSSWDSYTGDATLYRNGVNNRMLAALAARTTSPTASYDGYTFAAADLFPGAFARAAFPFNPSNYLTRVGSSWSYRYGNCPVSAHILLGASHYGSQYLGARTIGSTPITSVSSVHLREWALTNGYSAAELTGVGSDIEMIVCTGTIPDSSIPYVASASTLAARYGSAAGLSAVLLSQAAAVVPYALTSFGGGYTAKEIESLGLMSPAVRSDLFPYFVADSWYTVHVGDSGHPIMISDPSLDAPILLSCCWTVNGGPAVADALPIIKSFVIAHGDTLKEL